jgi:hypothetical protein
VEGDRALGQRSSRWPHDRHQRRRQRRPLPGVDYVRAWGNHQILPDGTAGLMAVTGVLDPTLTSSAFDCYHTHAATLGTES